MTAGADLARRYHDELVGPLLRRSFPGLAYAAGRLGSGSDVLGLDDDRSADHDWGLRLTLLLDDPQLVADVDEVLERELPASFEGWATRFPTTWKPSGHQVDLSTPDDFAASRLGVRPDDLDDPLAWLALTGQSVLEVAAGPVFVDASGRLTAIRERLAWYPDDVWRYVVASGWRRLSQELPFVGRTGERGDDLGSRVIAARLARDVMHLGYLIERQWPPYPKWFGARFAHLRLAAAVGPALAEAVGAVDWRAREAALVRAIDVLAVRQRDTGLPCPEPVVVAFWDRPFRTVDEALPGAIAATIADPRVRALPLGVGSVEQWVDNVDVLSRPDRRAERAR